MTIFVPKTRSHVVLNAVPVTLLPRGEEAIPLFVLSEAGKLTVVAPQQAIANQAGQKLISIASNVAKTEEED